jgi:glycosyltransferase involved in cell wall biosynthesis
LKEKPLISICIPAYNAAPFITEAIIGWTRQTYKHVEIIVQDDYSTDNTYSIALGLAKVDERIRVYKNSKNYGIGKNWNECYEKAVGDYVVIFNADDTINQNFIEDSLKILNTDLNLDMVIHNYVRSSELDKKDEICENAKPCEGKTYDIINTNNEIYKRIHWNFTLSKRASINKLKNQYGLFYPTQVCDGMLWFEAYRQKIFAYYCAMPAGIYRDHETNNSKIKFGEFESTFLWMLPIYSDIFLIKHPGSLYSSLVTIIKYLFNCIKHSHKPKIMVIYNLLKYGS